MAAHILHSLTDDNPDLQKQLGCMTGIFQLFDRQHIVSGRRLVGHSHRRGHQGKSYYSGNSEPGSNNAYPREPASEMNSKKNMYERQRLSTESSRVSFSSSSCSSSLSSIDYNRTAQPEHSSFDRITFPETTSRDSSVKKHTSESPKLGRQSLDLRDLVKESMYRETRGLSTVKTTSKEESLASRVVNLKDSPRGLLVSKSVNGSYGYGFNDKQGTHESIRGLAKLRDAPWQQEANDDAYLHTFSKDHPRFSYDGRETNRLSFESRETIRSTRKIKDSPRLSLDGREGSARSLNSNTQSIFIPQTRQKGNDNNANDKTHIIQQTPLTQKRPPSVVAKLMGLDALPDSAFESDRQTELIKTQTTEDHTKTTSLTCPIHTNDSPVNSWKGPASPRWLNQDSGMRPLSSSRFPIEPAPWKQQPDASRGSLKTGSRQLKSPTRASNTFPSVYSEIEKRLKDLEFNQSGKDLRALKQILEAMQAKGLLQTEKEERDSNLGTSKEYDHKLITRNQKLITQRNPHRTQVGTSSRNFESPIVIMKPAKLVHKTEPSTSSGATTDGSSSLNKNRNENYSDSRHGLVNGRTARDQTSTSKNSNGDPDLSSINRNSNGKVSRPAQSSSKPQQSPKENTTSPRIQQKKLELDKRSRPPIPSSDKSKSRRQPTESSSPGRKLRQNTHNALQQSDDQLSEVSIESRDSSCQGENTSMHSEGTTSFDSKLDSEVASLRRRSSDGSRSPSIKAAKHSQTELMDKKSSSRLNESGLNSLIEFASVSPQHPSPVSVLDTSVYRDDSPSPVNMESALQDYEPQSLVENIVEEEQFKTADNVGSGLTSEINRKKLQNIDNLVQKLRRLNSNHDEARTDYIASLCDKTSTDHRYISEILLASGLLLRDLGSTLTTFQLHPSGQPINPELFFVLEQTKSSTLLSNIKHVPEKTLDSEKAHRKLIFTAVNELLATKLGLLAACSHPSMKRPGKLATKNMTAQQLLRELCTEIDQLQENKVQCNTHNNNNNVDEEKEDGLKKFLSDDVMYRSENWTDFSNETSGLILDVERSLFKELVDEIIRGETANARLKPGRRCRKLFSS